MREKEQRPSAWMVTKVKEQRPSVLVVMNERREPRTATRLKLETRLLKLTSKHDFFKTFSVLSYVHSTVNMGMAREM